MVAALRDAICAIIEDKLGLKAEQIGNHYQRSWAEMAMYMGECPVYTIMMIGRWSSDAFLKYIRKQVEQFSHNVAKRMIKNLFYRHIPDVEPRVSQLDPRQRNYPDNSKTKRNVGGNLSRRKILPAFSQHSWELQIHLPCVVRYWWLNAIMPRGLGCRRDFI